MATALRKRGVFTPEEVMYRDKFDAFFTYLEEMKRCIDLRLVSPEDLRGLKYWMEKIANTLDEHNIPVFQVYVAEYYTGVIELMKLFGTSWSGTTNRDV